MKDELAKWYTWSMESARFEALVRQAMVTLPDEIKSHIDNVDVLVQDLPTQEFLAGHTIDEGDILLGLYEGVPLTERADYGMVLPDRITLFQKAIEAVCDTDEEVVNEVRETVAHEVAHHFGIDDEKLEERGV